MIVFWRRHADCHVLVTDVIAVTQLKLCFCATFGREKWKEGGGWPRG